MSTTSAVWDLQDLLVDQTQQFDAIRRVAIIFCDKSTLTRSKAVSRLDYLQELWKKCVTINVQLHQTAIHPEDKQIPYFTEDQFSTMENIYLDTVCDCKEFLYGPPGGGLATTSDILGESSTSRPSESRGRPMQVPLIKLPRFSGMYTEWPEFRDYFTSLFIADESFDNLQRLHYLKSCLDGEAALLLKHMSTTSENFEIAWKALSDRFSNKRRVVTMHMSNFFALKFVNQEGSPQELRKLLDSAKEVIEALKSAEHPLQDDTIVFILNQRVDRDTREAWELQFSETDKFPTFMEFETFLNARIRAFEAAAPGSNRVSQKSIRLNAKNPSPIQTHLASTSTVQCPLCTEPHALHKCKRFLAANTGKRWEFAKQTRVCFNCLTNLHRGKSCSSKRTCVQCGRRHHSALHNDISSSDQRSESITPPLVSTADNNDVDAPRVNANFVRSHLLTSLQPAQVVLATAWLLISAPSQRVVKVRALLDQGSTHTFVSSALVNALNTRTYPCSAVVSGIGRTDTGTINRIVPITVTPTRGNGPSLSTEALILDSLTGYVPQFRFPLGHWDHLRGLQLADERPTDDTPIHAIIGADLYVYALREGIRRGRAGEPVAQNTLFGWVISGNTSGIGSSAATLPVHTHHVQAYQELNNSLRQFWEIEEVSMLSSPSEEDSQCERHFRTTHSRMSDGRYVVRIPIKHERPFDIGDTRVRSKCCLTALEKRLSNRPIEHAAYSHFLREYESLGHMRLAPVQDIRNRVVYLPHHPVVKVSNSTSKIRVVFNASAVSSNGRSFNEYQMVGPKLQSELPLVHTQWRSYKYVCCADIVKMYRQILVDERDIDLQRILWRNSPTNVISAYQLLTVTYGNASSPFLALRVLRQLAEDDGDSFPLAKRVLEEGMYVDDALFGADTLDAAKQIRAQLIALLDRGGFQLSKWASNSPTLLQDVDPRHHSVVIDKSINDDNTLKVLGIKWHRPSDSYQFVVKSDPLAIVSKRLVLSTISRLYDPLGWLSPVVVVAKIFLQSLWKFQLDWDSPLPDHLANKWHKFYDVLSSVNDLTIPRWIGLEPGVIRKELHGFSDASATAYAAVIYLCTESSLGIVTISLIVGKTKVAPVKQVTIPRLELCGALLLARLMAKFRVLPMFKGCESYCWTDATIVLAWLKEQSSHWKAFVANRVAEIHSLLPNVPWRHVPGIENPADLGSRGVSALDITQSDLWWYGPPWLSQHCHSWPNSVPALPNDAPLESKVFAATAIVESRGDDIFPRFSSWPRMLRVIAVMLRWSPRWTAKRVNSAIITADAGELECVSTRIFKLLQAQPFSRELRLLTQNESSTDGFKRLSVGQTFPRDSPIRRLNPILDSNGLLRVGGRLSLSQLDPAAKFPVILNNCYVVRILIEDAHRRCIHGSISLTLSTLRSYTWVLQARKIVKSVIFHCVVCARIKADMPSQLMGYLPPARVVRPCRPFAECGIDYAGPVSVRMAGGRGARAQPAYIAVFVCMATKAVHLELVTAYSTSAFLAALHRFSSRRGTPKMMHSDRGTNFQGADKELSKAFRAVISDPNVQAIMAEEQIKWKFIPPAAPHFGGLWEAGVKAMKHHLKRALGNHTPTFEELTTLLCRIEACMNSRPLGPLHDDAESLDVLTPAHFLVGGPLAAVPLPSLLDTSTNRLSRWQAVQQMLEQFWQLWSRDYIQSCQHRTKWTDRTASIKVGQIVLLRNENLPPTKWNLGRIVKCHPGPDGLTRVVTVKTALSEYVRPIVKLAMLPLCLDDCDQHNVSID